MMAPLPGPAHALTRLAFLAGTPADALARAAAQARWIDAKPQETVADFDDATTDVFFIVQGAVRVLLRTADGARTQILGDFSAGDLIGEMSAIDGAPRSAQLEALVRTRLCVLPAATFLDVAFASRAVSLRLAAELLRLGRARSDGTCTVSPPPTQEELAARVGARRETVSRELSALTHIGLVRRTRAAFVLEDPAKLRAAIDAGLA